MLNKYTLLKILRTSTMLMDTDGGPRIKVVCRYQQYRAACKIIDRLRNGHNAEQQSGVIRHTQGSGKSLTMVFAGIMIKYSGDLSDYKIVLINDRIDLEQQLSKTATLFGGRVHIIENTDYLRRHLSTDSSDVNIVMVHKFREKDRWFESYIDTYRLMDAAHDGATIQIPYEGRTADATLNEKHGFETANGSIDYAEGELDSAEQNAAVVHSAMRA